MTIGQDLPDIMPALTPEQHALFVSAPHVPHRAVELVVAELGMLAPHNTLLRVAVRGTVEAVLSHELRRDVPYADWALFHAIYRVYEHLGRAQGSDTQAAASVRAAMAQFLAHEQRIINPVLDTRARCAAMLRDFSNGLLVAGALTLLQVEPALGAEDEVVEIEHAAFASRALREVYDGLRPEQRLLLERCFAYDETVKEAAVAMNRSYHTVLRDYHELLVLMGARLRGMGVHEVPRWIAGLSGEVFDVPAANDPRPP